MALQPQQQQHQEQHAGSASGSASASSSSSGLYLHALPFGDTTYTKIFVGGLAWETNSERLRRFYERFGDILEAVVITDRHSGRSKGYGFVTFRDSESARKACDDPTPVIDGRRANCNLASLGRAQPPVPLGRPRSAGSYFGVPVPRGVYVGGYGQQRPIQVGYYQGFPAPQYGYTTYGTEYIYPQATLNPYIGQQYVPIYGVSTAPNTANQPFSQLSPSISGGVNGYVAVHGYNMPGNQFVQLTGSNFNSTSPTPRPSNQAPFLRQFPPIHTLSSQPTHLSLHKLVVQTNEQTELHAPKHLYLEVHLGCSRAKRAMCCVCSTCSYLARNHPCIHKVVIIMVGIFTLKSLSCPDGGGNGPRATVALVGFAWFKFYALMGLVTGRVWSARYSIIDPVSDSSWRYAGCWNGVQHHVRLINQSPSISHDVTNGPSEESSSYCGLLPQIWESGTSPPSRSCVYLLSA